MKHLILRATCVLMLVLAQHSALVHAISHAVASKGVGTPAAKKPCGNGDSPVQAGSCALDPAYSSVLGAAHGTRTTTVPYGDRFAQLMWRQFPRASTRPVSFFSRGPPPLL